MQTAPTRPAAGKLNGFVGQHKTQLIVGLGAVGVALYLKNRSSATGTGTNSTVPTGGYPSDPYSAAQDAYNSIEPQLESLQSQLAGLSTGSTTPAPAAPPPAAPALAPTPAAPRALQSFSLGSLGGKAYTLKSATTPGAVQIFQGNTYLGSYWIPNSPGAQTKIGNTGLSIQQAGDKATGALAVNYQGKRVGSYQT